MSCYKYVIVILTVIRGMFVKTVLTVVKTTEL